MKKCVSAGISLLSFLILTSCGITASPPEKVYEEFRKACSENDLASAERHVTQTGIQDSKFYGVCETLLPDGINKIMGFTVFTFKDMSPSIEITGDTAYLSWFTDNKEVVMTMYKDKQWKIQTTMIYDRP